jgi:hypothetical protein
MCPTLLYTLSDFRNVFLEWNVVLNWACELLSFLKNAKIKAERLKKPGSNLHPKNLQNNIKC